MKNKKSKREFINKGNKDNKGDDGTFISYKNNEDFNGNKGIKYGYEQDSCDL